MSELLAVFVIATLGYLIGRITICGIDLGTAAVLLVALVFGHFGITTPALVRDIGLVCFVTAVGFIAGPKFFRNFKQNAKSYVLLGFIIILVGALSCAAIILLAKLPTALGVGLMTGALTSTPGLAAAIEASGNDPMASIGYGIAYPFGVISVVLFVQLMPKILHVDVAAERKRFEAANSVELKPYTGKLFSCDSVGLFPFSIAIALGLLLAAVTIPLPGGAEFSLGTSGGPLIVGLIIGHLGRPGQSRPFREQAHAGILPRIRPDDVPHRRGHGRGQRFRSHAAGARLPAVRIWRDHRPAAHAGGLFRGREAAQTEHL